MKTLTNLLTSLNPLQRCIVKRMLFSNAELHGYNSVPGRAVLEVAYEVEEACEGDDQFYEIAAIEFVLKTM